MDVIIKAFSGLFMTLIVLVLGIGIISASINTGKAERFASDSAVMIGNSNFDRKIIAKCQSDAKNMGYVLDVNLVGEEGSEHIDHGTLKLKYRIVLPIISVEQEHYVESDIW